MRIFGTFQAIRSSLTAVLVVAALAVAGGATTAFSASVASVGPAVVAGKALINGDSVVGAPSQEEAIATALGFTVTVVDDATWATYTAADFGGYDLLIVGDPSCGDVPAGVVATASVWGPVVLGAAGGRTAAGNRVVVGTDPVYHDGGDYSSPDARGTVIREGIAYAGNHVGATGMYFDTTCGDANSGADTVAALSAMSAGSGTWTINTSPPCGGAASLIAANPGFVDLTTTSLQGWDCSVHESFPTFPTDWSALAVATDTPTVPTCGIDPGTSLNACGEAYVLVAGSSIVVGSKVISVSPLDSTNPVGTNHTVVANVHAIGGTPPVAGQLVAFTVTGQNAGATGTCVPVDCKSAANGDVSFTYTDTAGAGDDTIKASFTDSAGSLQTATAQKHWVASATHVLNAVIVGSGSVASTPSGIACPTTCVANFSAGSAVGLTPTPAAGFTFMGWSGACTGSGACNVTMDADKSVTATFATVAVARHLTVATAGSGAGSVTSSPAGISCPTSCGADFADGAVVDLTALANAGSTFTGWSGACTGSGACNLSMNADESVTATFSLAVVSTKVEIDGNGRIIGPNKTKIDIDVKRKKSGRIKGDFEFKSKDPRVEFESSKILTLDASGNMAMFTGTGKFNGHRGFTFVVAVTDNHDDKANPDRISIEVKDASGTIVFSTDGIQPLRKGDIDID